MFLQESGGRQSQGEVGIQQHVLGAPKEPRLHQHGGNGESVVAHGSPRPSLQRRKLSPMHSMSTETRCIVCMQGNNNNNKKGG